MVSCGFLSGSEQEKPVTSGEKGKKISMVTKSSSSEQQMSKDDFSIIKLISNGAYG
jgi:hypothetical protein